MEALPIPAWVEVLEKYLGRKKLECIRAETPARWAKPLSYTLNSQNQVIALNLKGARLRKLPDISGWEHLQRLDISRNDFTKLVFDKDLPQLELLEASYNYNPLEKLVFNGRLPRLRYLYVYNSALEDISFAQGFPASLVSPDVNLNLGKNNLKDENLRQILEIKDLEQQGRELLSYFKVLNQASAVISRVKLIFLGNTGAGKTTLHDILTGQDRAARGSTHGLNQFSYQAKDREGNPIEVAGFDFGGQDYYHSTHTAFFSNNALYFLVWGNGQANAFDQNPAGENLFPLAYWLGSAHHLHKAKKHSAADKSGLHGEAAEAGAAEAAAAAPEPGAETPANKRIQVHTLQNLPIDGATTELLNSRDIAKDYPFTQEHAAFCLKTTTPADIKKWVDTKLAAFAEAVAVPKVDREVEKLFERTETVLIAKEAINTVQKAAALAEADKTYLLNRLHRNLSCYYPPATEWAAEDYQPLTNGEEHTLATKIIVNLDVFTDWFYAILDKTEMVNQGYLTREAAQQALAKALAAAEKALAEAQEQGQDTTDGYPKTIQHWQEAQENLDYLLAFMLQHKIIFRVQAGEDAGETGRYIAPNFLPETPDLAAQLLLNTFEPAVVQYRFTGFFHTNVITELLARFFGQLLVSREGQQPASWKYLLWKNKVLLYEKPEAGEGSTPQPNKKLLYIHFDFAALIAEEDKKPAKPGSSSASPAAEKGKEAPSKIPVISLHRFAQHHISDGFLQEVMNFIEQQIADYPMEKRVRTPTGRYIPFKEVERYNQQDGQPSNLVFYAGSIYRRGDFNMFLPPALQSPMKKIFISYSKDDLVLVNQFLKHLAPLERSGLIAKWYCTELQAGTDWDTTIQAHFDAADIICFMVSPNFLATEYIDTHELKKAIDRKQQYDDFIKKAAQHTEAAIQGTPAGGPGVKDLKIVPIIMKHCVWSMPGKYDLSQYTALPYTAKPVADFKDTDTAWMIVAEGIRILCNHYDAVNPVGEEYYKDLAYANRHSLGKQLLRLFERIVEGKLDNNA